MLGAFVEDERLTLRSAHGRLECERARQLVRARIPAQARILDAAVLVDPL